MNIVTKIYVGVSLIFGLLVLLFIPVPELASICTILAICFGILAVDSRRRWIMKKTVGIELREVDIIKTFCDFCGNEVAKEHEITWDAEWWNRDVKDTVGDTFQVDSIECLVGYLSTHTMLKLPADEVMYLSLSGKTYQDLINFLSDNV